MDAPRPARPALRFEPLRAAGERVPFRPDIEGLRGVAVLLVVLYHAGIPAVSGGYVGVDVFFALSGYLITDLLAAEVEATGRVDLRRFYARRARRLLPAIGVLLLAVGAFAYVFYSPLEQRPIAETALATALYVSNVVFAQGATNYLAAGAEANPLLHTWSLAVEEQFYLGWPLLVWLAFVGLRRQPSGRRLAVAIAALAVVSFGLALWLLDTLRAHWAFFASPPRAWEFALGGLGALLPRMRWGAGRTASRWDGARVLGWLGLAGVVWAGVSYTQYTPFPGWTALAPVVGTVWALRAGAAPPGGQTAAPGLVRVLGWRPLQTLGRLSYSWYLWHWPVLVFAVGLYGEVSLGVRVALAAASLVLAEASYRLVENPVRHARRLRRPAAGLALLAAVTVGGAALSAAWVRASGAAASAPGQTRYAEAARDLQDGCITGIADAGLTRCALGDTTSSTVAVLYGDSHAHHWLPTADRLARERGWRLETVMKNSCGAVDATRSYRLLSRDYVECDAWRARALAYVDSLRPALVVVASAAESYEGVDPDEWVGGTRRVLSRLADAGGAVLQVRDVPRPTFHVPACLARAAWRGGPDAACSFPGAPETEVYAAQTAAARGLSAVTTADLTAAVCPGSPCEVVRDDTLVVYRDTDHLTASFARTLAPDMGRAADRALARPPRP